MAKASKVQRSATYRARGATEQQIDQLFALEEKYQISLHILPRKAFLIMQESLTVEVVERILLDVEAGLVLDSEILRCLRSNRALLYQKAAQMKSKGNRR